MTILQQQYEDTLRENQRLQATIDAQAAKIAEETAIVDRVWRALNLTEAERVQFIPIDERVATLRAKLAKAEAHSIFIGKSRDEWEVFAHKIERRHDSLKLLVEELNAYDGLPAHIALRIHEALAADDKAAES